MVLARPLHSGVKLGTRWRRWRGPWSRRSPLGGLHQADPVLAVSLRHLKAAHLRLESFGNGESGRIVRGAIDAKAAGETLKALVEVGG